MRRRKQQRGSAVVEFAFTGIPLIFIWIGIFWMSFGMWRYHTLQYACKAAGAYLSTHGALYVNASHASIQVKDVAAVLAANAVGLPATEVTLTLTAKDSTKTCRLDACKTDTTAWPPTSNNVVGTDITVKAAYTMSAAFAMWNPAVGATKFSNSYALTGYSHQQILF